MLHPMQYLIGDKVVKGRYAAVYVSGPPRHPNVIARVTRRDGFKTKFGSSLRWSFVAFMCLAIGLMTTLYATSVWQPYLICIGIGVFCTSLFVIAVRLDEIRFVFDERKRATVEVSNVVVIPYNALHLPWATLYKALNGLDEMSAASHHSPLSTWVEQELLHPSPLNRQLCIVLDVYLRQNEIVLRQGYTGTKDIRSVTARQDALASRAAHTLYRILRSTPEPGWVGNLRRKREADSRVYS